MALTLSLNPLKTWCKTNHLGSIALSAQVLGDHVHSSPSFLQNAYSVYALHVLSPISLFSCLAEVEEDHGERGHALYLIDSYFEKIYNTYNVVVLVQGVKPSKAVTISSKCMVKTSAFVTTGHSSPHY